jgi:HAMP domain-containing protein
MTVAMIAAAIAASTGLFALWVWVMGRIDEREERRQADEMRHREPPVLGGGPRHLRPGDRRW